MLHAFVGQDPVHSVAVSPAGSVLLSGVGNRDWRGDTVRLWDATTGRLASSKRLDGSWYGITVGFSSEGARAVSRQGPRAEAVGRGNGAAHPQLRWYPPVSFVGSVALSPDGTRLVAVSDEAFKLWDVATGQAVRTSEGRYGSIWSIAFSPDGTRIVWGNSKTLTLWDAATGSHVRTVDARPMEEISAVALSPDSNRILSAGRILSDGRSRAKGGLWDVATGQLVRIFGGTPGRCDR